MSPPALRPRFWTERKQRAQQRSSVHFAHKDQFENICFCGFGGWDELTSSCSSSCSSASLHSHSVCSSRSAMVFSVILNFLFRSFLSCCNSCRGRLFKVLLLPAYRVTCLILFSNKGSFHPNEQILTSQPFIQTAWFCESVLSFSPEVSPFSLEAPPFVFVEFVFSLPALPLWTETNSH